MCLVPCLSAGRELLVDFTDLFQKWKWGQDHSFSGIFSVVSPCLHLLLMSSHPRLFQPNLRVLGETTSINECNDFSILYSSSWTKA